MSTQGVLPKDGNFVAAIGGTSSATDTAGSIRPFQYDPSTRGLTVHIVGSDVSGSDGAIVDGASASIKATVFDLSNSNPLATQIVDANGDAITSFGGGTQYTEGDTDASITGTAMLWEDTSDTLRAVSVAHPLPVETELPAAASLADSTANPSTVLVGAANQVFNGTSWDRVRSVTDGLSTGIQAVGIMGFNGANYNVVRNAYQDAQGNGEYLGVANTFYNGSSWDRMRGDTTNGLDVDVTRLPSLPAGSNAIGKLAANSGVDIGDVDITSIIPGTGATNLGKAEDAAHTTGDVGVMALGVRAAAPTERSAGPTDGDYEPFATNEVGAVWVTVTPSANGGASTMNATSSDGATALTSTAQAIKASAGTLKGYYIYNPNSSAQFVQFYNTASGSVTVGTTNPLFMLTIPATSAANLWSPDGIAFSSAMSWSATSTAGGNGAPGTALDAVAWYK